MNSVAGRSPISIGIISLITVFSVVMLTSFAVLIITGAQTDSRLADLAAESVTEYYIADAIAEENRQKVYEIWQSSDAQTLETSLTAAGFEIITDEPEEEATPQDAETEQPSDELEQATAEETEQSPLIVGYSVPINDIKNLVVQLELPTDKQDSMKKLSWKATPII